MALTDAKHHIPTGRPDLLPQAVTLSGRDIEDARRLLGLLAGKEEQSTVAELARLALERPRTPQEQLILKAREILAIRQTRAQWFGKAMFGEPAWEMLLLLYVTAGATRQTVSRLAQLAPASKATAIRWLDYLSDQKLVRRQAHPTDKRTTFVELTDKGRDLLEAYLADTTDLTA